MAAAGRGVICLHPAMTAHKPLKGNRIEQSKSNQQLKAFHIWAVHSTYSGAWEGSLTIQHRGVYTYTCWTCEICHPLFKPICPCPTVLRTIVMGRSANKINVICSNMCETLTRNKRIGLPYTDLCTACLKSQFGWIMVGFSVSQMNHWFSFPNCWPPRDGIDAADTLGQHSVGNQFRQLRTPWGGQHGNRGTLAGQKFASHLESCWMHLPRLHKLVVRIRSLGTQLA